MVDTDLAKKMTEYLEDMTLNYVSDGKTKRIVASADDKLLSELFRQGMGLLERDESISIYKNENRKFTLSIREPIIFLLLKEFFKKQPLNEWNRW